MTATEYHTMYLGHISCITPSDAAEDGSIIHEGISCPVHQNRERRVLRSWKLKEIHGATGRYDITLFTSTHVDPSWHIWVAQGRHRHTCKPEQGHTGKR